jgi:hypothetical protein
LRPNSSSIAKLSPSFFNSHPNANAPLKQQSRITTWRLERLPSM